MISACRSSALSKAPAAAARSRRSRPRRGQSAGRRRRHALVLVHDRQHGAGAGGGVGPGLGRRPRRGAPCGQPLFGDDQSLGDVRRGAAGGETARPGSDQAGTWVAPISRRAPAASIMRSRPKKKRSNARGASSLTCRRRSIDLPPTVPCTDDPARAEEALMKAVPRSRRQVYKMRPIIDAVVDKGSFFEVNANFGRPIIVGLARLEGRAVLLLASDPMHYGGSWTAEACQKVVRWVDFAETFHLPIVYLMDCPGFMIGLDAEKVRHHPPRRAGDGCGQPDHGALVHHHCAQRVRRGRCRASAGQPIFDALRLAVGLLGFAAAGRRHRGGLSRRDRCGATIRRRS